MATAAGAISALEIERTNRRYFQAAGVVVILVGAAWLVIDFRADPPLAVGLGLPFLVAIPWIWQDPVRGIYALLFATLIFETGNLNFPDSLTDQVPFFTNVNHLDGLQHSGLGISPAELTMSFAVLAWVATGIAARQLSLPRGRLTYAYLGYAAVLVLAEVNGLLLHHGDLNTSGWELRPQAYGFIMFLLVASLVRDRAQVAWLAIVLMVAEPIKAGIGAWRYFFTLNRDLGGSTSLVHYESIMAHEESYLFCLFLFALLAALIWYRRSLPLAWLLVFSPLVFATMILNQRRAGELALGVGAVALVVLAMRTERSLRKQLAWVAVIATIAGLGFVIVFWNAQYGFASELVRPIRSQIQPTARDLSSDKYRKAEDGDLHVTFRSSPFIGIGLGLPFETPFPLTGTSTVDPLYNIIPHNSLLWPGMRMGTLGLVAFWGLIGLALLEGMNLVLTRRDPFIRAVAAFAVAALLAQLAAASVDVQLESWRPMLVTGVILGLLDRLPSLADG